MKYFLAVLLAVCAFSFVPATESKAGIVITIGGGYNNCGPHYKKPYKNCWTPYYNQPCYKKPYWKKKKHNHCW